MNKEALFCDGTTEYVIPIEPECNSTVTLRFRTAKDDSVRVRLMTKVGGYDMEKSVPGELLTIIKLTGD